MFLGATQGGSLTPPPASLGGLGIFGAAAQRFSTAPGTDRSAAAAAFGGPQAALAAAAAAGLGIRSANNGSTVGQFGGGTNINFIGNPANMFNASPLSNSVGIANKMRHNSSEKAASNRSKLLEDFRYMLNALNRS